MEKMLEFSSVVLPAPFPFTILTLPGGKNMVNACIQVPTQEEPHEPWSRISLIVGQFGHWVRASKESGREAGSILWVRTGSEISSASFSIPHKFLTCSSETPSKFTPACRNNNTKMVLPQVENHASSLRHFQDVSSQMQLPRFLAYPVLCIIRAIIHIHIIFGWKVITPY